MIFLVNNIIKWKLIFAELNYLNSEYLMTRYTIQVQFFFSNECIILLIGD